MSPLAKYHRDIPGLCERFEAFVCKKGRSLSNPEMMSQLTTPSKSVTVTQS